MEFVKTVSAFSGKAGAYDVGFIGCGNMGGAILSAVAGASEDCKIAAYDADETKARAFADKYANVSFASAREVIDGSRFVFLGLKPQVLPGFVKENIAGKGCGATFVSMAAGVALCSLADWSQGASFIRIMPNIPVAAGQGLVLYVPGENVADSETAAFEALMRPAGMLRRIDEAKIDAASAISGCGPAFVWMFTEALADGGVRCGLTRAQATEFAAQTLLGSAQYLLETGAHPDELKDRVCSPGGSTIEGVLELERGAFRSAVSEAVTAAYKKTLDLGKR